MEEKIKQLFWGFIGICLVCLFFVGAYYGATKLYQKYTAPKVKKIQNSDFVGIWNTSWQRDNSGYNSYLKKCIADTITGKFVLLFNNDSTFSLTSICDLSKLVDREYLGSYRITTENTIGLIEDKSMEKGYFKFNFLTEKTLYITWISGYKFLNSGTNWDFTKQ